VKRLLIIILAAVLLTTAACASTDDSSELFITVQDWTGWSEKQPQPTTTHVRLRTGESATVDVVGGELTVTVTRVTRTKVTITTNRAMSPRHTGGGIDLSSKQQRFTFARDATLQITTPTMDAGTTLTFKVQGLG